MGKREEAPLASPLSKISLLFHQKCAKSSVLDWCCGGSASLSRPLAAPPLARPGARAGAPRELCHRSHMPSSFVFLSLIKDYLLCSLHIRLSKKVPEDLELANHQDCQRGICHFRKEMPRPLTYWNYIKSHCHDKAHLCVRARWSLKVIFVVTPT